MSPLVPSYQLLVPFFMLLRGKKIILRPMRLADASRYVRWLADEQVTRFLNNRGFTLAQEREWIKDARKKKPQLVFAIETKVGKHIGSVGFNSWHPKNRSAVFGIFIGDVAEQGKGYGEEAMRLILKYGFTVLHLHRVELKVFAGNTRAKRLYKKLGFKREGILRDVRFNGVDWEDEEVWGLLSGN